MVKNAKNRWVKMITAMVLVPILLTGMVGCSGSKGENSGSVASGDFNQEGLPIVNKPVTLKVLTVRWGSMGTPSRRINGLRTLKRIQTSKSNGR